MSISKYEQERIIEETQSQGVILQCSRHAYKGAGPIVELSCKECCQVFIFTLLAKLPPSKRLERLDQLEPALHHMAEDIDRGTWDFKPFARPKIEMSEE